MTDNRKTNLFITTELLTFLASAHWPTTIKTTITLDNNNKYDRLNPTIKIIDSSLGFRPPHHCWMGSLTIVCHKHNNNTNYYSNNNNNDNNNNNKKSRQSRLLTDLLDRGSALRRIVGLTIVCHKNNNNDNNNKIKSRQSRLLTDLLDRGSALLRIVGWAH